MRIILTAGERLIVSLGDENGDLTDGEFVIDHAASESNRLTVSANLPGNVLPDLEMRAQAAFKEWDRLYQAGGMDEWEALTEEDRENWKKILHMADAAPFVDSDGRSREAVIYEEEWDNSPDPNEKVAVIEHGKPVNRPKAEHWAGQAPCDLTTMHTVSELSKLPPFAE